MDLLSTIQKPIEQDIIRFNDYYRAQFKSDVKLLNETLAYMGQSIGKMMRPMLVMLVAKSIGKVDEKTFAAASAMELLHTASLVHDDVIDASDMRRGNPSLNVVFNNNIAVLTGDFLFSQALNNAAMTGDVRVVCELSNLGKALSRGEMLQVELRTDGTIQLKSVRRSFDSLRSLRMTGLLVFGTGSDHWIHNFRFPFL